jgi:HIRAN domain
MHLFHLFSNRLMSRSRPDYLKYIESLNIPVGEDDPMTVLGRSGGGKATDNYEVFPYPEIDDQGNYHTYFFLRGLRYTPKCSIDRATELKPGDSLSLSHDLQNFYDPQVLSLQTEDRYNLGYCLRYLSHDIFPVLQQYPQQVKVTIDRVNLPPTPIQSRLLCTLKAVCGRDFVPFAGEEYQPLSNSELILY